MPLKSMPLSKQVSLAGASLTAAIILILVGTVAWLGSREAMRAAEHTIATQAESLRRSIDIAYALSSESATKLADVFESRFRGNLVVDEAQTVTLGDKNLPQILLNNQPITGQYSLVDAFTASTGGVATVFIKVGDDYIRASTSLKKDDGSRAVGTALDRKHPGFAAVSEGRTYIGDAVLFGKRYMTKYLPIRSSDNKHDLILFVGFDMSNLFQQLQDTVLATRVGASGVPYVVLTEGSRAGEVLIHKSLKAAEFKELVAKNPDLQALMSTVSASPSGLVSLNWQSPVSTDPVNEVAAFNKSKVWPGAVVVAPALKSEVFGHIFKLSMALILVGLIACLATSLALLWISRRITSPTKTLTSLALRLGNGDMTARAPDELTNGTLPTRNELTLLARGMNRMADSMEQALSAVKTNTERVQSASGNLVQTSHELSQGAARESDAASGMAAAVEEMSSSIARVGDSATDAKAVSQKARHLADDGLGAIHSATQQMHHISDHVQNTAQVIAQLGEQSREISAIAQIIKGIAEQTNLLALNAAIEAARAGEQGRGFSVVADEVRKLAERTRKSTDDIHGMIQAIQNSSEVAVNNMELAVNSVQKGVDLVDKAGNAMTQITQDSSAVAMAVEDIHAALIEQNQASGNIGKQVDIVAHLSDNNLHMAQKAREAVEGLQSVATDLNGILQRFQVNGPRQQTEA
ncbi:MAG: methyl-accepting chemotaxis protein [Limnobacter sp.]|uniref:methyl-accepting chemotaxis protein n=1 Tax=Limnobacter sp. TaxID=2003368 RepID=UPI00391BC22F